MQFPQPCIYASSGSDSHMNGERIRPELTDPDDACVRGEHDKPFMQVGSQNVDLGLATTQSVVTPFNTTIMALTGQSDRKLSGQYLVVKVMPPYAGHASLWSCFPMKVMPPYDGHASIPMNPRPHEGHASLWRSCLNPYKGHTFLWTSCLPNPRKVL